MLAEKNQDIKKAYDILQIVSKDEKARILYEAREAELRDQLTRVESAENKGEVKGRIDDICKFLEASFGADSQVLQDIVRDITDLDVLSRIVPRIFMVASLDEANVLLQGSGVVSQ